MIISYNVEVVKNYDVNIPKLIDQVVKTLKEDEEGEVEGWMILNEAGDNIDYHLRNLGFPDSDYLTDYVIDDILDEMEKELVKQGYEC
jgi:hypothetical protein